VLGPAEIESVLVSHPQVAEAAAIGVPHPVKGESLVCFVVLIEPTPPEEELVHLVESSMGKALKPAKVIRVQELPKTRNGKVVRRAIKAQYLGQPLGDVSAIETRELWRQFKSLGGYRTIPTRSRKKGTDF